MTRGAFLFVVAAAVGCARAPRPTLNNAPVSPPPDSGIVMQSGSGAEVVSVPITMPVVTVADLDKRTAALFGDALRVDARIPLPNDVGQGMIGTEEPRWDIEVRSYETFERVRHYVTLFTGPARERFAEGLSAGSKYEPMIRAKLRAGDLPEDMYYLALVESGFNPHAYSRAAAVGMWQFMSSTARGMGLRVDWWIDERRDPVRSTDAAIGFLRGLREQFGSLYLAAAAYNGGPGRIARGLTRYASDIEGTSGDDAFFTLSEKKYLRNETREYVPQLIASALVAKEPSRYGMTIETRAPLAYDSVRVGPRVTLAAIAQASGTTIPVIQQYNPQILRGMTPPKDSMFVRLPTESRAGFDSAFATLPESTVVGAVFVTADKNATWTSIGKAAHMSARVVSNYNPKVKANKKTGRLGAGTVVLVPTAAAVDAALPVPDPSIERYGRSAGSRSHIVKRGESIGSIAKRYGVTTSAIMRDNRLKKPLIFPGQELIVHGGRSAKRKT